MPDFSVERRGTDSSGRGIFATGYMWAWFQRVKDSLDFGDQVVVTQGAFMTRAGGGASASAGYHDFGGCFDLRVWNLTEEQQRRLIRRLREYGAAAWLRNLRHGGFSDPHIHFVLGSDRPLSTGAAMQWDEYKRGLDGMHGRDYHRRPDPLVLKPPTEDPLSTPEAMALLQRIDTRVTNLANRERERFGRTKDMLKAIDNALDDDPTPGQIKILRLQIKALVAALEEEN